MWPFTSTPKWRIDDSKVRDNLFLDLAGVRFYGLNDNPRLFSKINIGDVLIARHEPDNPFDANALGVYTLKGIKLGHLPRVVCRQYTKLLTNGTHCVSISKLERTLINHNGLEAPLFTIGVRFPIYEGWNTAELEYKPHGFLTSFKGHYYLYTDGQLTKDQYQGLAAHIGQDPIESPAGRLLEIAPDKFHDFKFKYKFPLEALKEDDAPEFLKKLNDQLGITLPLKVEDIEKATGEKYDAILDDLAEDDDKLRKQVGQLQTRVTQLASEVESLKEVNAGLNDELELIAINTAGRKSGGKEAEFLIKALLPNIELLHHSVKFMCGLRDFSGLARLLQEINSGNLPKGDMINVTREPWFELKYSTGDHTAKPAGRLYYHRLGDGVRVAVLVGEKETQGADLEYLKKWKR